MLLTGVDQGGGGPSGKEKFEERTQRITHRLAIPVAHLVPRRNWVYTAHVNRGRGLTSIRSSCNRPAVPGQDEEITRWAILRLLLQEIKTFTDQTTATTDYTWDAAGNMLSKINLSGNTTYAWNYDNRLMSVTDPNNQVTAYGYDPFGIRVRMTDGNGTKRFLYSKEDIIGEFDGANTQTAYYVHGPLTDEPLVQVVTGTLSYLHRDGLGSVTAFSSTTGQLAGTNNYYAFGKVNETIGVSSRYGYTSRELDPNGLMYYRSRYYSTDIGRFLNQDFYKGDALIPPSLHRYVYTHNNPVNYVDYFGNDPYTRQLQLLALAALLRLLEEILPDVDISWISYCLQALIYIVDAFSTGFIALRFYGFAVTSGSAGVVTAIGAFPAILIASLFIIEGTVMLIWAIDSYENFLLYKVECDDEIKK